MALADTAALVSTLELQDKFSRTAEQYDRALGSMERRTSTFGKVLGQAQAGIGTAAHNLSNLATIGAGLAVAGLTASIRAASSLEESLSKVNVVFGDLADETIAWASTSASAFGQSKQQALEAAGTYGNLFQAFGIAQEPAQEMSIALVQLAADLASFNNTSVDDALIALRSGLSGETEPLKRYGIAINDARLRTVLANKGFKNLGATLTAEQKALAAYTIIMEDSVLAQGDFARTSGGLANQSRILKANLQDTAATIGTALLPKITELAVKFNDLLLENQPLITDLASRLPALFDSLIGVAEALPWDSIANAFTIMGTGSKALLDAFLGLPPWVQTAVLTGWGLNKLTGGALTSIVGALASGLVKGVLGINAGVVNVSGAVVNAPGGPGGGPGTGPTGINIPGFLASLVPVIGGFIAGGAIGGPLMEEIVQPAREFFEGSAAEALQGTKRERQEALDAINAEIARQSLNPEAQRFSAIAGLFTGQESLLGELTATRDALEASLALDAKREENAANSFGRLLEGTEQTQEQNAAQAAAEKLFAIRQAIQQSADIDRLTEGTERGSQDITEAVEGNADIADRNRRDQLTGFQEQHRLAFQNLGVLERINAKDFSPSVTVTVNTAVSISDVQRIITSQQISVGKGPLEFE